MESYKGIDKVVREELGILEVRSKKEYEGFTLLRYDDMSEFKMAGDVNTGVFLPDNDLYNPEGKSLARVATDLLLTLRLCCGERLLGKIVESFAFYEDIVAGRIPFVAKGLLIGTYLSGFKTLGELRDDVLRVDNYGLDNIVEESLADHSTKIVVDTDGRDVGVLCSTSETVLFLDRDNMGYGLNYCAGGRNGVSHAEFVLGQLLNIGSYRGGNFDSEGGLTLHVPKEDKTANLVCLLMEDMSNYVKPRSVLRFGYKEEIDYISILNKLHVLIDNPLSMEGDPGEGAFYYETETMYQLSERLCAMRSWVVKDFSVVRIFIEDNAFFNNPDGDLRIVVAPNGCDAYTLKVDGIEFGTGLMVLSSNKSTIDGLDLVRALTRFTSDVTLGNTRGGVEDYYIFGGSDEVFLLGTTFGILLCSKGRLIPHNRLLSKKSIEMISQMVEV